MYLGIVLVHPSYFYSDIAFPEALSAGLFDCDLVNEEEACIALASVPLRD